MYTETSWTLGNLKRHAIDNDKECGRREVKTSSAHPLDANLCRSNLEGVKFKYTTRSFNLDN